MAYLIPIVCSWCGESHGHKKAEGEPLLDSDGNVAHTTTICKECLKRELEDYRELQEADK